MIFQAETATRRRRGWHGDGHPFAVLTRLCHPRSTNAACARLEAGSTPANRRDPAPPSVSLPRHTFVYERRSWRRRVVCVQASKRWRSQSRISHVLPAGTQKRTATSSRLRRSDEATCRPDGFGSLQRRSILYPTGAAGSAMNTGRNVNRAGRTRSPAEGAA